MKSKAYRAVGVNEVDLATVLKGREQSTAHVGFDIGKKHIYCVVRWGEGDFGRPWRANNPDEVTRLAELLGMLGRTLAGSVTAEGEAKAVAVGRPLIVAMEPTGTYGDALRQALSIREAAKELQVHAVSPKQSSDYAEVFDGVPSQHDAKDAAVVAELAAHGKSRPWPLSMPSDAEAEIAHLADAMDRQRRQMKLWTGTIEAHLSRHWPEATRIVKLCSGTLLRCLEKYGGPRGLSEAADGVERLKQWGGRFLPPEKAEALAKSARSTRGLGMHRWEETTLRRSAMEILQSQDEIRQCRRRLEQLAAGHASLEAMSEVVGASTACVLWSELGDPAQYHCGSAYRKAMGLNLAERSSGAWKGQLRISKRGSSRARRWLYLAALRWVKREPVRSWYARQMSRRRGATKRGSAKPVLVGVMRKLALALYQVAGRGEAFDAQQLYRSLANSNT